MKRLNVHSRIFIQHSINVADALKKSLLTFSISLLAFTVVINAQAGESGWEEQISLSVENMILSEDNESIDFLLQNYVDDEVMSLSDWNKQLVIIREQMHHLDGDVGLSMDEKGLILAMANRDEERQLRIILNNEKRMISELTLIDPPKKLNLTWANLMETFDNLENDGMSGIIYIKKVDGEVIERSFGYADRSTGRKNKLETIFGTGSRPIDYTIAAIQLLDQQGKLKIDDPIINFFEDVPEDKKSMTLLHLMTGRSGLPDFFDNESDWDADLAWVDRNEAIKRMISQKLLFAPGEGRSHSHGAFGLLAAIIEIVSGESYYSFIRQYFLDPAGMTRTGEYGESRGLSVADFAVGSGPQKIGLPNIPPNWGPTSWLIKGSGGMYSTLGDLQKFYDYIRSGKVLDEKHNMRFKQATANLDGSMRGFELFSMYEPGKGELYLFSNEIVDQSKMRTVMRALERLLVDG